MDWARLDCKSDQVACTCFI